MFFKKGHFDPQPYVPLVVVESRGRKMRDYKDYFLYSQTECKY